MTLCRPLAVLVAAMALTVTTCGNNTSNAPSSASRTPSPPVTSSAPPRPTIHSWAKSMCQALGLAHLQLGTPPQPDLADPAATRQAFGTYLSNAANVAQQAIDLLSSIGAPPVDNGQQVLDQMRTQLTQLHGNLTEMATQLKSANTDDVAAIGPAFGAIGNVAGLFGTLTKDPQLRAALDETPECQVPSG